MFVDAKKEGCGIAWGLNLLYRAFGEIQSANKERRAQRGQFEYAFFKAWNNVWFVHAAILLTDIFKELAKELVQSSSSRYVCYIKISIDLRSQNRSNFPPSYFVFFMVFDDLSAAMKSDYLVLDSSDLRRARPSLYFACLPPKLLQTNSKVRDICCWVLFFCYVHVLFL